MTHSMADGLSIHNPITNPMNLYNPYLKNMRNKVIYLMKFDIFKLKMKESNGKKISI